jgi:Fe-S-cluster containining protein
MTGNPNDFNREQNSMAKGNVRSVSTDAGLETIILEKNQYATYHSSFQGDTFDACARCRGYCEKYKIATLMPGEKEYMAEALNVNLKEFEDRYLDRLDTPFGDFDVLKLKDGCNFLDDQFRCTAGIHRPVLCDSYPLIVKIQREKVKFFLDKWDCPMVRDWSKDYAIYLKNFQKRGIASLEGLRVPAAWWKAVAVWDKFDFDCVRIEKELRTTTENQTFMLEEVLAFACNGYEKSARIHVRKMRKMRNQSASEAVLPVR